MGRQLPDIALDIDQHRPTVYDRQDVCSKGVAGQQMNLNQVTLPCTDYDASVFFYKKLGLRQIVDSPPRYARFETPTGATLSIHASETDQRDPGVVIYFEVDDVDANVRQLEEKGLSFDEPPKDQR